MKMKHALIMAALTLGVWGTARADETKPATDYPLDTCVVSGQKLGEMGKPHQMEYKGQTVLLCCKNCVKKFNKDPEKYMAKIAAARAAAAKPVEVAAPAPAESVAPVPAAPVPADAAK